MTEWKPRRSSLRMRRPRVAERAGDDAEASRMLLRSPGRRINYTTPGERKYEAALKRWLLTAPGSPEALEAIAELRALPAI